MMDNLDETVKSYEKALALYPKDNEALMWLGGLYAVSGEKTKALERFNRATASPYFRNDAKLSKMLTEIF